MSLMTTLNKLLTQRAAYLRTRNAIRALPLETALDLDIYPGDAVRIARAAVYG
jgi:hypothetical protein